MNMHIMSKERYDAAVKGYKGSYPALLTTIDGESLNFEYDDGHNGWKPEGVIIEVINNSNLWPSYPEASRCLGLAKIGWRGQEMKEPIDSHS